MHRLILLSSKRTIKDIRGVCVVFVRTAERERHTFQQNEQTFKVGHKL